MAPFETEFKKKCYQEVDGYYVFYSDKPFNGFLDSGALKQMAAWLDEMNADWDKQVRAYPKIGGEQ